MLIKRGESGPVEFVGPQLRVWAVAKGLLLQWRDHPNLLFDVYLMGEANFIRLMRQSEADAKQRRAAHPDEYSAPAMHEDLTDAQWGEVYAHVQSFVKKVAARGKWRRRKDTRIDPRELRELVNADKMDRAFLPRKIWMP